MSDIKHEPAVVVKDLYKTFKLPHDQHNGIKQAVVNVFRGKRGYELQHVLNDVSFEIKKGEFFGIVGRNGSGKSTLLKLLAGIYVPDKGLVQVNGSLTPFIELGVGFNPELTGRENVFMNGALLGFDRSQMEEMYESIVDFAEINDFMDQKLKNYSSGMQVRLAFSIAIRAQSDILLLDEVLAVGDAIFQKKCYDYFKQLKKEKRTVIFVSHDIKALQEYCDKGILINDGQLIAEGKIDDIINEYVDILIKKEAGQEDTGSNIEESSGRHGTGKIKVGSIDVSSAEPDRQGAIFTDKDKELSVTVTYKAREDVEEPVYGITIYDSAGERVFVTNNMWLDMTVKGVKKGQDVTVTWKIPNAFNTGTFKITPAVANAGGGVTFDQVDDAFTFKVRKRVISNAAINIAHEMVVK